MAICSMFLDLFFCKKKSRTWCRAGFFVNLWLLDSIQGIDAYRPASSPGKKEKVIKEVCKTVESHDF